MNLQIIRHMALLVILFSNPAYAEKTVHGKWIADSGENYVEAFTSNSSGSSLGMLCDTSCIFYLRSDSICEEGSKTVGLINSESGALSIELHCTSIKIYGKKEFLNVFGNFDDIQGIVLKNYNFGIALPMESGMFKVLRFDLTDANEAISKALERYKDAADKDTLL